MTKAFTTTGERSGIRSQDSSASQNTSKTVFGFADHRPETLLQRKLHQMANHDADRTLPLQKMSALEEEELLQGKFDVKQRQELEEEDLQLKASLIQKKDVLAPSRRNNTGLPDHLQSSIESLSGYAMDDVKVYYNSNQPSQINAHAYARGTDIHLGPGQEKHLPHEAWHVVQQKQGRVKPTLQLQEKIKVNDDVGLEKEADAMGKATLGKTKNAFTVTDAEVSGRSLVHSEPTTIQAFFINGKDIKENPSQSELLLKKLQDLGNLNTPGQIAAYHELVKTDIHYADEMELLSAVKEKAEEITPIVFSQSDIDFLAAKSANSALNVENEDIFSSDSINSSLSSMPKPSRKKRVASNGDLGPSQYLNQDPIDDNDDTLSYEAEVVRLRANRSNGIPKALFPLFYGSPSDVHADPYYGEEDEPDVSNESATLLDPSIKKNEERIAKANKEKSKRQAKQDQKVQIQKDKADKRYAKAHKKELRGDYVKLQDDDDNRPSKSKKKLSRRVLSGIGKAGNKVQSGYGLLKEKANAVIHPNQAQGFHSFESEARRHWRQNEQDDIKSLLDKWQDQFKVSQAFLLEFLNRQYPALGAYVQTVLGVGMEVAENEITSAHKSQGKFGLMTDTVTTGLYGAQSGMAFENFPRDFETVASADPSTFEASPASVASGGELVLQGGAMMRQCSELHKALQMLEGIDNQLALLDQMDGHATTSGSSSDSASSSSADDYRQQQIKALWRTRSQLVKQMEGVSKQLSQSGVASASNVAGMIMQAAGSGDATGVLSIVTTPLALYQMVKEGKNIGKLKGSSNILKGAIAEMGEHEVILNTAKNRLNKQARGKGVGIASKAVSTTAGATAAGFGIAGLVVGSVFSAGIVVGVVALAGGAIALGYKINETVSGYKRGQMHKELHFNFQEELQKDDPDLDLFNQWSMDLMNSDPQVIARALFLALHNSRGDDTLLMVEVLRTIGVGDELKLSLYNENKVANPTEGITENDILTALKS